MIQFKGAAMDRFIFLILCGLLAVLMGCATSPTVDLSSGGDQQSQKQVPQRSSKAKEPVKKAVEEEVIPLPPSTQADSVVIKALKEAIKSNEDQSIFKAAVDVLAQNPKDAKALNALGVYYYRRNDYPASLYMFTKAESEEPRSSEIQNNLGLTQLALGRQREAFGHFRKALELDPRNAVAALNIGSLYVENQDYVKAEIALEKAYSRMGKDFKLLNNYAIASVGVGKYDKAKKFYREAIKIQPSNKELMHNYAILLIEKLNDPKEGIDIINRLRFLGPSPSMKNKINLLENKAKESLK